MAWYDNYTLIIPTHNRPSLLRKLISYLSHKKVTFKIIVLDSSDQHVKRTNIDLCANSSVNMNYFDYPMALPSRHKLLDALEKVSTEYVSFCGDDDVVFPDSLQACIDYLSNHPDYVACQGYYLSFREREDNRLHIGLEYASPSIDKGSPPERMLQLLKEYESPFYGVYRSSVAKRSWEKTLGINSSLFFELFHALVTVASGKVRRLNCIYYGRNPVPPAGDPHAKWQPTYWFAENPEEIFAEYVSYRNFLLEYCTQFDQSLQNDAKGKRLMDLMHGIYFANSLGSDYVIRKINSELNLPQHQKPEIANSYVTLGRNRIKYIIKPKKLLCKLLEKLGNFLNPPCTDETFIFRSRDGAIVNYKVSSALLERVHSLELEKALLDMTAFWLASTPVPRQCSIFAAFSDKLRELGK